MSRQIYLLGLTIYALGTSEFMVAGMMPSLTQALGISVVEVGHLISLYAAGMVVGGPVLTALLLQLRVPNKGALLTLLALYAAAQSVAAIADSFALLASARVMTGVFGAACFGVSLAICADAVAPEQRGRAASIVLGGLMLAAVLGVPMATLIDLHWGWRASFWLVVILTAACAGAIALWVPVSAKSACPDLNRELRELRNPHLWMAYLTSALIIGATFAAFSYFAPILTELSGMSASTVPWLLAGYGATNVLGNAIVGRYADRRTFAVLVLGLFGLMAVLVMFALNVERPVFSVAMLLAAGMTGITLNPAMAARVMRVARPGPLVNTLHASVINIGLGAGALLGGLGIDSGYGLRAPLWVGAALAALGLASLLPYATRPQAAGLSVGAC